MHRKSRDEQHMIIFVLPGLNGGTFLYYNGGSFPNTKTRVDPVREQWSSSRQAYQYNCNSNILTDIRRGVAIHRRTQYHLSRNGAALRLVCSVLVFSSRIRVLLYSSITSSVLCDLPPVWPRLVRPTNLMSRMDGKKTHTHTHTKFGGYV